LKKRNEIYILRNKKIRIKIWIEEPRTIIKIKKREILPSVFVQRSEPFRDNNSFKHLVLVEVFGDE